VSIAPPQLPANLDDVAAAAFDDESSLEACRLIQADLTGKTAKAVSLDEVLLEKVVLAEAKLERLTTRDVVAKSCDFSAAQCPEASFLRASFDGGRMTGWDCNKGTLKDVLFTNCKLDMTNFRFARMTRVRFAGCVLTNADFLGAELHDVTFENCLLDQTEFAQCKMKNVDLRTSQTIGLKGWRYLKGATIDSIQLMAAAPYLAQDLGIIVED